MTTNNFQNDILPEYEKDIERRKKDHRFRQKKYRKAHPEKAKIYYQNVAKKKQQEKRKNADKHLLKFLGARSAHKIRCKKNKIKNSINDLTFEESKEIMKKQNGRCVKCGMIFVDFNYTYDHITPLIYGGGFTKNNIQFLHHHCNTSKGNKNVKYNDISNSSISLHDFNNMIIKQLGKKEKYNIFDILNIINCLKL
jgi:5-methylcytosine-specific restriction endonuclease McrA